MSGHNPKDPRCVAAIDLIGRTGATGFQLRFSDDEQPVVWIAVAEWRQGAECAAALAPVTAVIRLLEQVVDGGQCTHCKRPSGVSDDFTAAMPLEQHVCWYVFDPELVTFRRSCEGAAA